MKQHWDQSARPSQKTWHQSDFWHSWRWELMYRNGRNNVVSAKSFLLARICISCQLTTYISFSLTKYIVFELRCTVVIEDENVPFTTILQKKKHFAYVSLGVIKNMLIWKQLIDQADLKTCVEKPCCWHNLWSFTKGTTTPQLYQLFFRDCETILFEHPTFW